MPRVRQIISTLSYDKLVEDGIIPDLFNYLQTDILKPKKYPPFVYELQDYSLFGYTMDYICRGLLRIYLTEASIDLGHDSLTSQDDLVATIEKYNSSKNINDIVAASATLASFIAKHDISAEVLKKYIPTVVNIGKEFKKKWTRLSSYVNNAQQFNRIFYNVELNYENISGHPDIITENAALDIKCTGNFFKMSKSTCLQLLSYYCLMKKNNYDVQYVGLILPMQKDITLYQIDQSWNIDPFLEILQSHGYLIEHPTIEFTLYVEQQQMATSIEYLQLKTEFPIGRHIKKLKTLELSLLPYIKGSIVNGHLLNHDIPLQMFLRNSRSGKINANTDKQLEAARKVITEHHIQYFTHSPYLINLCTNECDETGDYWMQKHLNDDLKLTSAMGGRGVVVHIGSKKDMELEHALNNMENMIRRSLEFATSTCPLLLETNAHEGTDICYMLEDLREFCTRFTEEERHKLGIVVDTAHVWAVGYEPMDFLTQWHDTACIPIRLVHFNDSKVPKGSCADRHERIGCGQIGMKRLREVARWSYERNIPMVVE